ncbi:MAG: glycyl-radical enzyme activating protein [Desulfatiglans sp.]|nr:glycyl-radical enzyme activating protein [Thermodesulfobacteriota bacterium]MEE4351728.1 glycyl-radical enzyme activating protein [Desulfatiglans sp.]
MSDSEKGLIFNIQRFSIHDGPGIRTTMFMKGCPLHCRWCSNPESMSSTPEIMTFDAKCIGCKKCVLTCPQGAISFEDGGRRIQWDKCDQCLECAEVCPSGSIERVGRYIDVDEAVVEIEKDKLFYANSKGGVTFSGGEPLNQWKFVRDVSRKCQEKGIHTTLDTTGYAPWDNMVQVLEHTDLVLFDIKQLDSAIHKAQTGVGNELILENVEKTVQMVTTWLRIPVIPGFNDSVDTIKEISEFGSKMEVKKISLLPYHQWGAQKYARLGRDYPLEGLEGFADEYVEELGEVVKSCGLETSIGS